MMIDLFLIRFIVHKLLIVHKTRDFTHSLGIYIIKNFQGRTTPSGGLQTAPPGTLCGAGADTHIVTAQIRPKAR